MLPMFRSKLLLIFLFPVLALAYVNPGKPGGFVNDFAGMLTNDQKNALENKLVSFERESGNEISIVTISNLGGDTIENFAVKLFQDWGIGKKGNDNGILVLIAKEDKKMRIEVGYGLEGTLTDAQSFWIIDKIMKPAFQQENYYQGIEGAVDKIIAATKGEVIPEGDTSGNLNILQIFPGFFVWGFFIFIWLASILGRSKSWWAGGVVGGVIGVIVGFIKGFLFFGLLSLGILIPLGLLFDFFVSRAYKTGKEKGKIPWWAGGGRRGGGFSGSGFGGFGGGRSGGGGASGGW